ncbi:unnamed protein product, partial [Mesorhabditis belari]|uniref:Carboxypeptidase n=1 Tax=Mesorhabditis belari TaxID=2138241 RepID=A0AAF3F2Q1_9BILA
MISFDFWVLLGTFLFISRVESATKDDDLITNLPGLTFTPTFKQYSGYLDTTQGNHLHYWFVEAQTNPTSAPLLLWLNGGPGCSSMDGFLTEMGPFRPTRDGSALVENVYSWNKLANMLYLESPRDIGYSYRDKNATKDTLYNDDKTAIDNVLALQAFFARFPEYNQRPFYVTGESYGGVYVPTLTNLLVKMIQNGSIPNINLVGMAVGNGALNRVDLVNSGLDLVYYRGIIGKTEFDAMQQCCMSNDEMKTPLQYCNFSQWVHIDDYGNAVPNNYNDASQQSCANRTVKYGQQLVWETANNVYNTWSDCYDAPMQPALGEKIKKMVKRHPYLKLFSSSLDYQMFSNGQNPFVDQGSKGSQASTDAVGGFSCYAADAATAYMNRDDVKKALHIPGWASSMAIVQ